MLAEMFFFLRVAVYVRSQASAKKLKRRTFLTFQIHCKDIHQIKQQEK